MKRFWKKFFDGSSRTILYATLATVLLSLLVAAGIGLWSLFLSHRIDSLRNAVDGLTAQQVNYRYGEPAREFEGVYSPEIDTTTHAEPLTRVYDVVGGEFFVCFEEKDGTLTAFASDFLPTGMVF